MNNQCFKEEVLGIKEALALYGKDVWPPTSSEALNRTRFRAKRSFNLYLFNPLSLASILKSSTAKL